MKFGITTELLERTQPNTAKTRENLWATPNSLARAGNVLKMESEVVTKLVHGEGPSKITMDTNKYIYVYRLKQHFTLTRQIVSCGRDSTSIVFHNGGLEEDTYQFDIERISSVSDIVCYKSGDCYMVAVATNDHNVLSYSYCSGNINNDLFAEVCSCN